MKAKRVDNLPEKERKDIIRRNSVYSMLEKAKKLGCKYCKVVTEPGEYEDALSVYSVVYNAVYRFDEFNSIFTVKRINSDTYLVRKDMK